VKQELGIRFVGQGERLDHPSQGATRDGGAVGWSDWKLRLRIARCVVVALVREAVKGLEGASMLRVSDLPERNR
jgi:hypothetical protein